VSNMAFKTNLLALPRRESAPSLEGLCVPT
jgi:hypothetical protein